MREGKASKEFFLKKEPKTFICPGYALGDAEAWREMDKSLFASFSSEKEDTSFLISYPGGYQVFATSRRGFDGWQAGAATAVWRRGGA
jgi:hypothetical protein